MAVPGIRFDWITGADTATVLRLYSAVGWCEPDDRGEWVDAMFAGSCAAIGAFDGDRAVGFARALSDGVSDAFIQDVVVDPAYRKRGIARELVTRLVAELERRGVDWIGLVGVPGTRRLYESCGFEVLEGYTPMRYTGRKQDAADRESMTVPGRWITGVPDPSDRQSGAAGGILFPGNDSGFGAD
ncbi:MAG: GNAT family N-acetyltransferase [Lentisphaeria bacterium]|nr:GNAT family N-acetyltransferase [Lentisphaeria bacterium]